MSSTGSHILIVDDEPGLLRLLSILLREDGYRVTAVDSGVAAVRAFEDDPPDLVIQDLRMPRMDGLQLLKRLKDRDSRVPVIILTAFSTWQTAVQAMRLGAFDYVKKPFDVEDIKNTVSRALCAGDTARRNDGEQGNSYLKSIIGHSGHIQQLNRLITRIASTDSTVLIQGDSGTGKELVARALHALSHRAQQAFISVNCGAFTETLLESELFGHVRGSFTGAVADKKGLFEIAHRGTLFLDEVGELTPKTQVKLLRVLEERTYTPVGGAQPKRVDIRLIAATNRDLEQHVDTGSFREDLFYRLNVIPLSLSPLRERRDDIPLLAGHFLARYAEALNKPIHQVSPEAMSALLNYPWPGNIRELENVVHRGVALTEGNSIELSDLPDKIVGVEPLSDSPPVTLPPEGIDLDDKIDEIERSLVLEALKRTNWHITRAAKILGIPFRSMRYRIKKLRIKRPTVAPPSTIGTEHVQT